MSRFSGRVLYLAEFLLGFKNVCLTAFPSFQRRVPETASSLILARSGASTRDAPSRRGEEIPEELVLRGSFAHIAGMCQMHPERAVARLRCTLQTCRSKYSELWREVAEDVAILGGRAFDVHACGQV